MPASCELKQTVKRIYDNENYFCQLDIGEDDDDGNACHRCNTFAAAIDLIEAVDDTVIHIFNQVHDEEQYLGWISVTLWNDGEEQVIDYTTGDEIKTIMKDTD